MTTIERLKSYLHYPIDWDSYGGFPLRKDVYDLTQSILSFVKSKNIPDPFLVLGSGGTVALEWTEGNWSMEIEVTSGESATVLQTYNSPDDVEYEVKEGLPESLSEAMNWFQHWEFPG